MDELKERMRVNILELNKSDLRPRISSCPPWVRYLPVQGQRAYLLSQNREAYYVGGQPGGALGGRVLNRGIWDANTIRHVSNLVRWNRRRGMNMRDAVKETMAMVIF